MNNNDERIVDIVNEETVSEIKTAAKNTGKKKNSFH